VRAVTTAIAVRKGSVYLPAEVVGTYFRGVQSVVVLIREGTLLLLPVRHATAGGYLLKLRNAAGDCVAHAHDVFLEHGLLDLAAEGLPARWSTEEHALRVNLPRAAN
jgi:hypothetical protein